MRYLIILLLFLISTPSVHASTDNDERPRGPQCAIYAFQLPQGWYDAAVSQGIESRTWFIGPHVDNTIEPYAENGYTHRSVYYFQKGRWECTPAITADGHPAMTWGRLATELMNGQVQISHTDIEEREPSEVHVAGDPGAGVGPTYRTMGQVMDEPAREPGTVIQDVINRDGSIVVEQPFSRYGITAYYYIPETDHTVASVFWDFMIGTYMRSRTPVEGFEERDFYPESVELIGFPTTEAYWTTVPVAGDDKDVLVQCFERRCLTFTPDNPDSWQVEMGNIGLHYYQWRYPDGDAQ